MNRKIDRPLLLAMAATCGFAAALILMAPPVTAWADTPHIQSTADTSRCAACHSAHRDVTAQEAEGFDLVGDSPTVVCLTCHDGDDASASNIASGSVDSFGLASGHSLTAVPAGTVRMNGCATCHDSHAASVDGRMVPSKTINGSPVTSAGPQLCYACHDAAGSWTGPNYPSTSAPVRNAVGYPVSGTWPGPGTYASATNAHRLIPESTQTVDASDPIRREQGDCLYCHAAHRGANEYDSLTTTFTVPTDATLASDQSDGSYAALCFKCHGTVAPSGFATAPVDVKQFATAGGISGGHSIITSGGTLPVGSPLPCFECHNPHGSSRGNHSLISDERGASMNTSSSADVRRFCFTCHTTNDSTSGWDSGTQSYVAVSSADKIVGISRDGGVLHLPHRSGHDEGDTTSCYECHGNSYDARGHNVHDPDIGADGLSLATVVSLPTSDTVAPITVADMSVASTGTVTLSAVDMGSGVATTYFELDGSDPATGTVITASAEGTHTVLFWSVDLAGNVEPTNNATFLVDRTAPVTTSDAQAAYVTSATITLSSQDNTGGAGVADTYWTLDGGQATTGTVVTTSTVGPHDLSFWSVDLAGNVEASQSATFTISDPATPPDPSSSPTSAPDTTLVASPIKFVVPLRAPSPLFVSREVPAGFTGLGSAISPVATVA